MIVGGGLAAWGAAIGVAAVSVAAGAEAEFKTFLAWLVAGIGFAVAIAFAQWTYSVASLAYAIEADALVIHWGFRRVVIPIDTILRMVPGRTLDVPHIKGLNWWGCHVGHADVRRIGYTLFYSTHSAPQELLYIHTTQESYALTVLDQATFAEEIQARAALAPIEEHSQRSTATGLAAFPFWRDRHAIFAAGASALACAVMVGYVFTRYPGLPSVIQINFPELGGIVRIGDRSELLDIAYAGAGILGVNLLAGIILHARERAAGLWLLASGGILQAVLFAAAVAAYARA